MAELSDFPRVAGAGAALYYWDGSAWQKWTGSPIDPAVKLYAWTGTAWVKLGVDTDGRIIISSIKDALPAGTNNIGDVDVVSLPSGVLAGMATLPAGSSNIGDVDIASAPTLTVQSLGSDKIFGMESGVFGQKSNTDLAAGTNTVNGDAVPTGKVWIITHAGVIYIGTVPTVLMLFQHHNTLDLNVIREVSITSGKKYSILTPLVLPAGDYLTSRVEGATLHDDLFLEYSGYQMNAPA